ncbi:MAG: shikimate dehydrogenase [Candidatus Krumholzibacteriia bacterium]|jgi:shikimate dehydrogenase
MYDVLELSGDGWRLGGEPWTPTKPFYAVIGDPIEHSLSPAIQNAALQEREIDTEYHPLRITSSQLRLLKDSPLSEHLVGFNVTAPHKKAVARLCDGRTDQARDLDAVNTVKVEDGKWMGHNTDSGGVLTVVSQAWQDGERPDKVIVLGAGGSGRAAIDAMLRWGVPELEVRNRSQAGQDVARRWLSKRQKDGSSDTKITVTGLLGHDGKSLDHSSLWIGCLAGGVSLAPFLPDAAGERQALLLDLRYGDQRPDEFAPLGFELIDGLPVLLMQGGLSFAWWCGPPVPWPTMREALI